jgi:RNA polymerase sigma-70 factor (ECF subfamily)
MEEENKGRTNRERLDGELVRRTLAGDNDAFTELVENYYRIFYALALGYLHDLGKAEDAIQEGLVAIHKSLPDLREPERFGSWAYTIIRRKSIRAIRELHRESDIMMQYSEQEEMNKVQDKVSTEPMEVMDMHAKQSEIVKAIGRLSEKYQEIIVLYYYQHLDINEISERLHLSIGAADVRLHRARKHLHEILQGFL